MTTQTLKHHSGFWLRTDAAVKFDQAEDEHGILRVSSAGRTQATQQNLINRWNIGGPANRPPNLYKPAMPASASNHVIDGGIAIDTPDHDKFDDYCEDYGFVHSYPGSDPVHFDFKGKIVIAPAGSGQNPFGIPDVHGLQKIANLYGAHTMLDNDFGSKSMAGFAQFLRRNYGYVGNNTLGPVMWAAIARWLRAKWGYVGNDVPGPIMRAALSRANATNYAQL